ncbi:putative ABC transport system ATP-binding protein [Clostridium cavendishii DSM 21758]|uniref:Putative ABC transport system ATP-binding protein n=1 Tax=Clostridium cavendishii DSM 21758 TaxID=1121302 RepID=A0A1M6V8V0_9CLOT|nr:ABC transporter ATP-binding protein [Clostridium cavendishii]SHK77801.1 putative ABC transport system ATP-binding protein [Clostridium cavendishii DSM 21758]
MNKIVEVRNLYKAYDTGEEKTVILKNICLDILKGEFVSIMGPSGCGKSTLLYLLGGLDKPTSGEVLINGNNIQKLSDKKMSKLRRKELGFVFQFYNLVQNLSVEDNILMPLLLDGEKPQNHRKEVKELLDIIELGHKSKAKPRELSGGQQQRVAIARALINNPKLILADEPIGNLDSKTGTEIMKLFKKINIEKGLTIVNVTHSLESAEYGTHIISLKDGAIETAECIISDEIAIDNRNKV